MPLGENCVREVPNTPRHLCRKNKAIWYDNAVSDAPRLVSVIINNRMKRKTSDRQSRTFEKRHGQDDARKASSYRPAGQPKKGSKTLFGELLTIQTGSHNAFFNTLRRQFQSKTKQHVRIAFCLCLCLAQHNESYACQRRSRSGKDEEGTMRNKPRWLLNTMSPTAEPGCQDADAEV